MYFAVVARLDTTRVHTCARTSPHNDDRTQHTAHGLDNTHTTRTTRETGDDDDAWIHVCHTVTSTRIRPVASCCWRRPPAAMTTTAGEQDDDVAPFRPRLHAAALATRRDARAPQMRRIRAHIIHSIIRLHTRFCPFACRLV